ncbi:MAG: hypothetical protein MHMPM18_001165 [Marteilia pararefringens]
MAERKQVNKYYPIDWSPSKGSVNKLTKSHPLRERAKKLNEGILTIRFEMPFNIWCSGCSNHIGMGVRFNAEKSCIDYYYSTPIFQFRMKCHLCPNYFVLRSDPSKCTYTVIRGGKRKEQRWDANDNNQIQLESFKERGEKTLNPMLALENLASKKENHKKSLPKLAAIKKASDLKHQEDYLLNRHLRSNLRQSKKESKLNSSSLKEKYGINCEIAEKELESDVKFAKMLKYKNPKLTTFSRTRNKESITKEMLNKFKSNSFESLF